MRKSKRKRFAWNGELRGYVKISRHAMRRFAERFDLYLPDDPHPGYGLRRASALFKKLLNGAVIATVHRDHRGHWVVSTPDGVEPYLRAGSWIIPIRRTVTRYSDEPDSFIAKTIYQEGGRR